MKVFFARIFVRRKTPFSDFENWVRIVTRDSLGEVELENIVEGADIDGDEQFDYKQHVSMVVDTLLQLNDPAKKVR